MTDIKRLRRDFDLWRSQQQWPSEEAAQHADFIGRYLELLARGTIKGPQIKAFEQEVTKLETAMAAPRQRSHANN
jgi:hypothetical protein